MDYWNDPLPQKVSAYGLSEIMSDVMKTSLSEHEEAPAVTLSGGAKPPGGHTIKKHAGKTDAELKARFVSDLGCKVNSGFYHDISFAETMIAKALLSNLEEVYSWCNALHGPGTNQDLDFEYTNNFPVGRKFKKKYPNAAPVEVSTVVVVLRKVPTGQHHHGRTSFVLTAYPK